MFKKRKRRSEPHSPLLTQNVQKPSPEGIRGHKRSSSARNESITQIKANLLINSINSSKFTSLHSREPRKSISKASPKLGDSVIHTDPRRATAVIDQTNSSTSLLNKKYSSKFSMRELEVKEKKTNSCLLHIPGLREGLFLTFLVAGLGGMISGYLRFLDLSGTRMDEMEPKMMFLKDFSWSQSGDFILPIFAFFMDSCFLGKLGKSKMYILLSSVLLMTILVLDLKFFDVLGHHSSPSKNPKNASFGALKPIFEAVLALIASIYTLIAGVWGLHFLPKKSLKRIPISLLSGHIIGKFIFADILLRLSSKEWLNAHIFPKNQLKTPILTTSDITMFLIVTNFLVSTYAIFCITDAHTVVVNQDRGFYQREDIVSPRQIFVEFFPNFFRNRALMLLAFFLLATQAAERLISDLFDLNLAENGLPAQSLFDVKSAIKLLDVVVILLSFKLLGTKKLFKRFNLICILVLCLGLHKLILSLILVRTDNTRMVYWNFVANECLFSIRNVLILLWFSRLVEVVNPVYSCLTVAFFMFIDASLEYFGPWLAVRMVGMLDEWVGFGFQIFGFGVIFGGFGVLVCLNRVATYLDRVYASMYDSKFCRI